MYRMGMLIVFLVFVLFTRASVNLSGIKGAANSHGFSLSGKISGYTGGPLTIYYYDDSLREKYMEIPVKSEIFEYSIPIVGKPFVARIAILNRWISLAIAPGYRLRLEADGRSDSGLVRTFRITGNGSAANLFCHSLEPGFFPLKPCLYEADSVHAVACFAAYSRMQDSTYAALEKRFAGEKDPYLPFFKRVAYYDFQFGRMEDICLFLRIHLAGLGVEKAQSILENTVDPAILRNISNKEYLASPIYIWSIGQGNQYLFYRTKLAQLTTGTGSFFEQSLNQIDQLFSGRNKSYYLHTYLNMVVGVEGSFEKFLEKKELAIRYGAHIDDSAWRQELTREIETVEVTLGKRRRGVSAPGFTLKDSSGKFYSLADFRGKVVLIDFWASWCGPCREEIPHLKKLYESYANRKDIVFLSIAVRDRAQEWRKAMRREVMPWLQLWGEGSLEGDYQTQAIPKFVIIDKLGQIVEFEAPPPSSGNAFKDIIDRALAKDPSVAGKAL